MSLSPSASVDVRETDLSVLLDDDSDFEIETDPTDCWRAVSLTEELPPPKKLAPASRRAWVYGLIFGRATTESGEPQQNTARATTPTARWTDDDDSSELDDDDPPSLLGWAAGSSSNLTSEAPCCLERPRQSSF